MDDERHLPFTQCRVEILAHILNRHRSRAGCATCNLQHRSLKRTVPSISTRSRLKWKVLVVWIPN